MMMKKRKKKMQPNMLLAVPPPPLRAIDADASLLVSIMEAGWPTIGPKERVALCHLL